MKVKELIDWLSAEDPDAEVMILVGFNGGGIPRTQNVGPTTREITAEHAKNAADCEDLVGQTVVVLGYGCY